jgi:PilZ domain
MLERRNNTRHRVLKAGTIAFNRAGVISCRVRNISDTGACLEVESPVGIPDQFTLLIENDHLHRPCRVSWRKEKRIGVTFERLDAVPIAVPKTDLARKRKTQAAALIDEET